MSRRTRSVAVAVNAWNDARRKIVAQTSQPPILRPEIVPPLADAVRLVNGDEPYADLLQGSPERLAALADQPLGRHVQQPAAIARAGCARTASRSPGSSVLFRYVGLDPVDPEAVDLILHQRDEWRHDEREPAAARRVPRRIDQRGRLKADGLAAARGEDDHAVARAENGVHRFPLQRPEARKNPRRGEARPAARDQRLAYRVSTYSSTRRWNAAASSS